MDEGSSAQSLISDEPLFAAPKMAAGRPPSPTPAPASAPYVAPTAPVAPASRRNEAKLQKNLGPAERRTIAPASSTEKRPQSPSSSLAPSAELSLKGYTFAVANYDEQYTNNSYCVAFQWCFLQFTSITASRTTCGLHFNTTAQRFMPDTAPSALIS